MYSFCVFLSSFRDPWAPKGSIWWTHLISGWTFWGLSPWVMSGCGSLYFLSLAGGGGSLDEGWARHWLISIADYHPLCYYSFWLVLQRYYSVLPYVTRVSKLGHPRSVRHGFYHMEWASSQIRYWLATSSNLVPPLPEHILQAGHNCRPEFEAYLVFKFLF